MIAPLPFRRSPLLAAALGLSLTACAVGPDYRAPATPAPAGFAAAGAEVSAEAPAAAFWTVFSDPLLSELVQHSLQHNHDLRIALANLNQARALRRETRLEFLPDGSIDARAGRELMSALQAPGLARNLPRDARENDVYTAGFDAIWELDIWGGKRRASEAAKASEQALEASLADVQVSIAAEVARNYFELRGNQERRAVAARNADNQRQTLALARARLDAGSGTEFDTARAQAQLSATLATLPALDATIENTIHRLSVLGGDAPTALQDRLRPVQALPTLPRLTAVGSPADLLRRRADIRAAERRLQAATAQIGVNTAQLFPQVSLQGEIGFSVTDPDDIGSALGETWNYGVGLHWSVFDFPRVQAMIEQTEAARDGSLARYEKTVLGALEETENALVSYGRSRQQLDHLRDSVTASDRAVALAHARYEGGASSFLDVLEAERAQLDAQDRYAQARAATGTQLVALYKALGGGWTDPATTRVARSGDSP